MAWSLPNFVLVADDESQDTVGELPPPSTNSDTSSGGGRSTDTSMSIRTGTI